MFFGFWVCLGFVIWSPGFLKIVYIRKNMIDNQIIQKNTGAIFIPKAILGLQI